MTLLPSMQVLFAAQDGTSVQTVWQFLKSGGPIMIPIALCSIVALTFALERWLRLRSGNVVPKRVREAVDLVESQHFDAALRATSEVESPAARILAAGLRRRGFELREVEGAMEDQGHKEFERLRANIRPLQLVGVIAPLLGLLGTVLGIQEAFHRVVKAGMGKPENLAEGIEIALVTTIAGLCVAIPSVIAGFWLTARARRLMLQCDDVLAPAVERLAVRPEGRDAA